MEPFRNLSVLLPVTNELKSLSHTVEVLVREDLPHIKEIIFIVGQPTLPESRALCDEISAAHPGLCRILEQKRPFLGGALQDAFEQASGSHTLLMASDLETDPEAVKHLVAEAVRKPDWIISASRWKAGGGFRGYGPLKLALNFLFQRMFVFLFRADLSDITYGFRIFPTRLIQEISWKESGHAFLFECLVKPLCLGAKVAEVPVEWRARSEGKSQASLWRSLFYLRVGFDTLLSRRERLLK